MGKARKQTFNRSQRRPCAPAAATPPHRLPGGGRGGKSGCISPPSGARPSGRKLSKSRLGIGRRAPGSLGGGRRGGVRVDREAGGRVPRESPALGYLGSECPGHPAERAQGRSTGRRRRKLSSQPRPPPDSPRCTWLGGRRASPRAPPTPPARGGAWRGGAGEEPRQGTGPIVGPAPNSVPATPGSVTSRGSPPHSPTCGARQARSPGGVGGVHRPPLPCPFHALHAHPHFQGQRPGSPEASWRAGPLSLLFGRMHGVEHREKNNWAPAAPPDHELSPVGEAPGCSGPLSSVPPSCLGSAPAGGCFATLTLSPGLEGAGPGPLPLRGHGDKSQRHTEGKEKTLPPRPPPPRLRGYSQVLKEQVAATSCPHSSPSQRNSGKSTLWIKLPD